MTKPLLQNGTKITECAEAGYASEAELQELLARHPEILPLGEVRAAFANPVTIGRECTARGAGHMDLVLMNDEGRITLVETKLAKNPEQKREVVAQCLEYLVSMPTNYAAYAKYFSDYRARESEKKHGAEKWSESVHQHVHRVASTGDPCLQAEEDPDRSEEDFQREVEKYVARRDVLVAIVGDKIKHKRQLQKMVDALNPAALGANATFCVIEVRRYQNGSDGYIIVPELVGRTEVVQRRVVSVDVTIKDAGGQIVPSLVQGAEEKIEDSRQPGKLSGTGRDKSQYTATELEHDLRSKGLDTVWDSLIGVLPKEFFLEPATSALVGRLRVGELAVPVLYLRRTLTMSLSRNARKSLLRVPGVSLAALDALEEEFKAEFPGAEVRSTAKTGTSYVVSLADVVGREASLLTALATFGAAMTQEVAELLDGQHGDS